LGHVETARIAVGREEDLVALAQIERLREVRGESHDADAAGQPSRAGVLDSRARGKGIPGTYASTALPTNDRGVPTRGRDLSAKVTVAVGFDVKESVSAFAQQRKTIVTLRISHDCNSFALGNTDDAIAVG
jgi:hypothetical protein